MNDLVYNYISSKLEGTIIVNPDDFNSIFVFKIGNYTDKFKISRYQVEDIKAREFSFGKDLIIQNIMKNFPKLVTQIDRKLKLERLKNGE